MSILFRVLAPAGALLLASSPVRPATLTDPLRFFAGRTETDGTVKVLFKKPFRSHSLGEGRIDPDGTLVLVQQVKDDGQPVKERRWRIRQVAPGRFSGTMSEAIGPVTVEQVDGRYHFLFKMKGNMSAEQWVTPLASGTAAVNRLTVRKLGLTVATSEGTIRKLTD